MRKRAGGIVTALAVFAIASAAHGDVNFPAAGGDISDPATWGGSLPGTGEKIVFTNAADVAVTAANDVQFGLLQNALKVNGNYMLTFDLRDTPSRKLKFNGFQIGNIGQHHNVLTSFKNGSYDFGGQGFGMASYSIYGNGHYVYVSDGATLTNINAISYGVNVQERLRMEVSGGSRVFMTGVFTFGGTTTKGNENWLEITDGSLFHTTGQFSREGEPSGYSWAKSSAYQPDGGMFYKDRLTVSGPETRFFVGNAIFFGSAGGSATYFTDGATITNTGTAYLWQRYTRNNLIRVSNGAHWRSNGPLYGGWNTPEAGIECGPRLNRIEILSGGELDTGTGNLHIGYLPPNNTGIGNIGNTLVISNGTLRTYRLNLGSFECCSNQYVVIQGPEVKLEVTSPIPFCAPFCEICVELGARFNPAVGSFGSSVNATHDEVMRVRSGGILDVSQFSTASTKANTGIDTAAVTNNALIVEAGGIVTSRWLMVQGERCSLRVDDSLVVLTNTVNSEALTVGYSSNYGGAGTNCVLAIAGRVPQIRLSGGLTVSRSSTIRFELPEDGYTLTPIVADGAISMDASSSLEFVGAEEMHARHAAGIGPASYVLADNPESKGFFSDDAVAAAQTALGDGFLLSKRVSDGRNQLVLRVRVPTGMILLLR